MGRSTEKEPTGLPIAFGRPDRPELVVNTPLVLKGGAASQLGIIQYERTLRTIVRIPGDENGDSVSVTTTFINRIYPTGITSLGGSNGEKFVLKDGQRKRVNLPGRGTIFLRIPRK